MKYTEVDIPFECESEWLLGILVQPTQPSDTGVVIIVGSPQYRAGSHRQFVMLARALAQAGHAVLRIDYRGMGDSSGAGADFRQVTADIAAAIDAFQKQLPAVSSVALWGLCDEASAALLYWQETRDPRVKGLCLLKLWVRSESSFARTQVKHYYAQRLMQREFWTKLFSGKVAAGALAGLISSVRHMRHDPKLPAAAHLPFQHRMSLAWTQFTGSLLLILSDDDYTAKEFLECVKLDPAWSAALAGPALISHDIKGADHAFLDLPHRRYVETLTANWLKGLSHIEVSNEANRNLEI